MTTADTLITNTQSHATAAWNNVLAFKNVLDVFVQSVYPYSGQVHASLESWLGDDAEKRTISDMASLFNSASDALPQQDVDTFPEIPDWNGDLALPDTGPFALMLEENFPAEVDAEALRDALDAIPVPSEIDTATTMMNWSVELRDRAATAVSQTFTERGGPMPAGSAIQSMVMTTHNLERVFQRVTDQTFDESYNVALMIAKARTVASKLSVTLRMKLNALSAIRDYLDAYLAELRTALMIDEKQSQAELEYFKQRIENIAATAESNSAIRDKMIEYFSARIAYEQEATAFQVDLEKHNDWHRNVVINMMQEASKGLTANSAETADAASRRAAAVVSALGSVVSSAVTSFA